MAKSTTRERQKDLHARWRGGDERAREELLGTIKGLIISEAARFRHSRISREDLKAEATLAALDAMDKWDPNRGTLAATVKKPIIKALLDLVRTSGSAVVVTTSKRDRTMTWHLPKKTLGYEKQGYSTVRAIELGAKDLGVDPELGKKFMEVRYHCGIEAAGEICGNFEDPADTIGADHAHDLLRDFMFAGLDKIEMDLVRKLSGQEEASLEAIAERHCVTRGRVTRIRDALMVKLRERCGDLGLSPDDLVSS